MPQDVGVRNVTLRPVISLQLPNDQLLQAFSYLERPAEYAAVLESRCGRSQEGQDGDGDTQLLE